GEGWVALSPIEHRLAAVLAERFGEIVDNDILGRAARPDEPPSNGALRVHMTRLRRRLAALSPELRNVRGRGYVMGHAAQQEEVLVRADRANDPGGPWPQGAFRPTIEERHRACRRGCCAGRRRSRPACSAPAGR